MRTCLRLALIVSTSFLVVSCGRPIDEHSLVKVSNGLEIDESEYPSVVMLYDKSKGGVCTGTFIDDETVLTAAHCTMGSKKINLKTGKVDHTVYMIRMSGTGDKRKTKIIAKSKEVYRNPLWDSEFKKKQVNQWDLGIIKFPRGTAPAIAEMSPEPPEVDQELTVVGYGLNYVPKNMKDINKASVGVKRMGTNRIKMLHQGFIYFQGTPKNKDGSGEKVNSAPGDSGGPMFVDGALVGVTSGGGRTLFGGGISAFIDINSPVSRKFLESMDIYLD